MSDFKNKTVVITGGSRGIGRACCVSFAKLGANIIFTYNRSQTEAEELKNEIEAQGVKCLCLQVDVKDFKQCKELANQAIETFEKVDILINNAGVIIDKAMMMMTEAEWLDVITTNLNGTFNVTRNFVVPFMKQKSGNIINMTSLSGIIGLPRQVNYSASKGGVIAFTRALAKEVAAFRIRVNAVAPGFIQTDMTKGLKEEFVNRVMPQIPLCRFGTVEEVAKAVIFLASDESNYITGQVLRVDGGLGM